MALDTAGNALLVRSGAHSFWSLPGEDVTCGEPADTALIRLLAREGIAVNAPHELFAIYVSHAPFKSEHIALYILRECRRPQIAPTTLVESGWFPAAAPPPATECATRQRLLEIAEGRAPADLW